MLPFGSITSIIPLFVLGFAYLVFLSTSAISKGNADTGRVSDDSKTIICSKNPEFQKENTWHWDSKSTEACDCECIREYWLVIATTLPSDEMICSEFFRRGISIRPPPTLS